MLYDRAYMKKPFESGDAHTNKRSVVFQLILLNVGIFILQNVLHILFPYSNFLENTFVFSSTHFFEGKIWTVLSYSFLHSFPGIWHIFANMLGLYFIGRVIEPILGSRTFLYLYLASGIVGALLYLSFHFDPTSLGGGLVGASAAVSGILAFFCLIKPEERITLLLFFVFPISLKPKWLLRAYAAISLGLLFTEELYGSGNIAHSAHLGGLLAGFLFYQFFYRDRHSLFQSFQEPSIELPTWFKKQKKRDSNARYSVNYSDSNTQLKSEVNRILDKINLHGFASLSEEEKSTLEKAKALFNR
ncbi:MAG: hypothetical protein CML12_00190 [Puniceicoccaceae bacterium]|nr:hypothetical protein [Puniceicoccaceae bacterium]